MSQTDEDIDVGVDEKENNVAPIILINSKRRRGKKRTQLSLYQSRKKCTKVKKNLRRRRTIRCRPNSDHDDSSTSAYSESENAMADETTENNNAMAESNDGNFSELPDIHEAESIPSDGILPNSGNSGNNEPNFESNEGNLDPYVKSCIETLLTTSLIVQLVTLLDESNCLKDFMNFVHLIVDRKLSVNNLPFLLLMDLSKFMCCKTTTQMRYRFQTMQFWKAVYRFGGGAVLRLFSGMKNFAQVCMQKAKKSLYDPFQADVNFAVPDVTRLYSDNTKSTIECGFIQETIDVLDRSKEYNLSIDGKKVSPGCSGEHGDIYLFGFEGPPSLKEQKARLNTEINKLDELIYNEEQCEDELVTSLEEMEDLMYTTTMRIKDLRITQVNQELLKLTFQKTMEKDSSTIKKFTHAISSIDTCQVFSNDLVERILKQNKSLARVMSKLRGNENNFHCSDHVILSELENCSTLLPPENIILGQSDELKSEYTKQGTNEWLNLRKQAVVTSSTIYAALGMDTIKKQKEIFKERVLGEDPQPPTPELERMFKHGRENEIHAFGTLAATVLPAFFHNCKTLTQVGSFFLDGDNRTKLVVVSPDALITTFKSTKKCIEGKHGQDIDYSVEFKAPLGEKKHVLPVHYVIPKYYVPQVLLQMKVLNVLKSIYGSYSKQSMVILEVDFDDELWKLLWRTTKKMFDKVTIKKLIRCSKECKEISEQIGIFVQQKCRVLCELPSCTASDDAYKKKSSYPFRIGKKQLPTVVTQSELKIHLIDVFEHLTKLINECYEMLRRKATEILMIVLNDTDRIFDPDSFYALPVAYVMKGYSLDVDTMRKILSKVMNKLKSEGIKVVSQSFDGQWHNVAVKGSRNQPLTRLQLQKKVWSRLGRITKHNLLKKVQDYTAVSKRDQDDCSRSQFLTVGKKQFGNLLVGFENSTPAGRVLTAKCMSGSSRIESIITKIHTPDMDDRPDLWFEEMDEDLELNSGQTKDIIQLNNDANVLTLLPQEFMDNNNIQAAMEEISENAIASPDELPDIPSPEAIANSSITPAEDVIGHGLLVVNRKFLEQILVGLLSERRYEMWQSFAIEDLYHQILRNQKQIEKLTSYEMDVINNVFHSYKKKYLFKPNDLKPHKVKILCKLFGRERKIHQDKLLNTKRLTLKKLCLQVIKDVDYPTNVLAVALANTFHKVDKEEWEANATMPLKIKLPTADITHECFSYPEYVPEREQLEIKLLDPTHILTNIRTHICTKGYSKVKRAAFLRVSEKNNTLLNRAYIVNLVDKQSAAIAMKFFSTEVQMALYDNNDEDEGDFVGLVRKWYEAVDERGLPVPVRIISMQRMYEYLTDMVDFDQYPPKKQYIGGIPILTFEGWLQNITSRLQLYQICGNNTYNHRSISTLAIETLFAALSRMEGCFNGCPKSIMIPYMLRRMIEMYLLQIHPNKIFSIHVSHKKKYPEHELMSEQESDTNSQCTQTTDGTQPNTLVYQTHPFDQRIRRTRKKRQKNVDLGVHNKPLKRESGVRIHFKAVESKIKSTTRHGLPN